MKSLFLIAVGLLSTACLAGLPARAQEVTKENVDGITNFHRLETTVACSGAIKATAVPEIKQFGFASIINLREASEDGANLEQEAAAAKAADIRYYSIPFNSTMPDVAAADKFVAAITEKGSDPATRVPRSFAVSASGMRTPPKLTPSTINSETTMALKIMLRITLAAK